MEFENKNQYYDAIKIFKKTKLERCEIQLLYLKSLLI
jgi:hypothetical protein